MAENTTITIIHDEIKKWIEDHDGSPALNDTGIGRGHLAVNFGDEKEYEPLSWDEFFDQFDSLNLAFQFGHAQDEGDEFAYSFIDRNLIPSEGADEDNGTGFPKSDVPQENLNPSASLYDNDAENMIDGDLNDDAVEDVNEVEDRF